MEEVAEPGAEVSEGIWGVGGGGKDPAIGEAVGGRGAEGEGVGEIGSLEDYEEKEEEGGC